MEQHKIICQEGEDRMSKTHYRDSPPYCYYLYFYMYIPKNRHVCIQEAILKVKSNIKLEEI